MPNKQETAFCRLYAWLRKRRFTIVSYTGLFMVLLLSSIVIYQMIYIARLETVSQRLVMRERSLIETNQELINLYYGYEQPSYLDNKVDVVRIHQIGKAHDERIEREAVQ